MSKQSGYMSIILYSFSARKTLQWAGNKVEIFWLRDEISEKVQEEENKAILWNFASQWAQMRVLYQSMPESVGHPLNLDKDWSSSVLQPSVTAWQIQLQLAFRTKHFL